MAAGAVCLAVSLTACGTAASGGGSGPVAPEVTITLPTPSAPASGKPLRIFFFNEEGASAVASSPESFQAAQAAVDYVNKNLGGVHGRPLEITHCTTLGTPESVTNCANKAVDAKPDVVIKGVEVASATAVPILAGAGLPYLTLNAGTPEELTNPDSFVLSAGFAAQMAPVAQYAKEKGYKSVGAIYTNVPSLSTALDGTVSKLFAQEGLTYVSSPVASTTGDLTPAYSALLAKNVDAVFVVTSAGQCAATLKARQSLADTHPLFMSSSCNVASVLSTVSPSVVDGTIFALLDTSAVASDKDTQTYLAAMHAYAPTADVGSFAPTSFSAIMDFYQAMLTAADPQALDAASVKKTLESAANVPMFMGGDKQFGCGTTYFPKSPSVCTGWAFLASYQDGKYQLVNAYNSADLLHGIA
ncbi:ABC transporter substrate-binding protein [Amycolatopsis sp.]|uniref:ABC transporter substrate-binding protein n=1 Tax=Amycolatopsis sp. TaxID=37632 RepID=UPI002C880DD6|nr:ABC transporter substrate-binding protein [Amycolatopsis sp.]HVV08142.1 ABC transporter substrate-binding protein [Amycolatopsis sp.]